MTRTTRASPRVWLSTVHSQPRFTPPAILIYFYFYRYTQPGFQDILIVGPVCQFNFHGYALGHFYKVAGGIIRGKKGKLSASCQTESRYFSANDDIRVPVHFHFSVLT